MKGNPFTHIETYPQMLAKIAMATFVVSIGAVEIVRRQVPPINSWLDSLNTTVELFGFAIPLGSILVAAAIGVFSRITKFHDRLSSVFGIRKRFDVNDILLPMALASGVTAPIEAQGRIVRERSHLMKRVFYKYVSATPGKEEIDKHYVTMALDQWSWYWIVLEASAVAFMASVILFFGGSPIWAYVILAIAVCLAATLLVIRTACVRHAHDEIDQILMVNDRMREVRNEFMNAISS